ncbi:hypothetical protein EGH24_13895 [Halonotius terrestris]|uniref:Uncharacterized protein n=1 Tax=Halonotius terrestris TaxID=2487750 RepID=A0A8J8TBL4_9EURY|nr:hypothetical protein [Halonotius terrestris]TQQ78610.1 hypothetical protein EGH24_13895 [Halonotius terrestris]
MAPTTRTTTVNSYAVELWSHIDTETDTRRVAAAFDRGRPEIDKIEEGVGDTTVVWLREQVMNFTAPDGYRITEVSLFDDGTAGVVLEADR